MNYEEVVDYISTLAHDLSLTFVQKVLKLEEEVAKFDKTQLLEHLSQADVIPEKYPHDSTEEKLYAKYSDALFAKGLSELGLKSSVIKERADAADVEAIGDGYSLVGDAKAFRLSRTAKNQKDFKVEALNQWKKSANYACLLGPLYQYPTSNSQIYGQATRYNVTLFSFTHLIFLIKSGIKKDVDLKKLWNVASSIPQGQSATVYWNAVLQVVLELTGKSEDDWKNVVKESQRYLDKQSRKEVAYWEKEIEKIEGYNHKQAVDELIKALKLNSEIKIIEKFATEKALESSPLD